MEVIYIVIIILLIVIMITQQSKQKKSMEFHEKEKSELRFQINQTLNESQKELTATVTQNYNELKKENNHELQRLIKDHDTELTKMKKYIVNLEKFSRNRGEILAHEILMDLKNNFIQEGIINSDEMIIMGNVFIPFRYKDGEDLKSRQIDHLILLPQGIYIIETKYWKGKVLQGISKDNAGKLSIMLDNIFPTIKGNVEKTLVLNPYKQNENNNNEFRVVSYDNPEVQVRHTAARFNSFIKEKCNKNMGVKTMVYFGYPQDKHNYVEVFSKPQESFPTLICSGQEDLKRTFITEIMNTEKKYNVEDLLIVQDLLNEYNRIN